MEKPKEMSTTETIATEEVAFISQTEMLLDGHLSLQCYKGFHKSNLNRYLKNRSMAFSEEVGVGGSTNFENFKYRKAFQTD